MLTVFEAPRMAPPVAFGPEQIADLSLAILLLAKDPATFAGAATKAADWVTPARAAQPVATPEEPTWEDAAWQ